MSLLLVWILSASGQAAMFAVVLLVLRFSAGNRMPLWLFSIGWALIAVRLAMPVVPENPWNLLNSLPPAFTAPLQEPTLLFGVEATPLSDSDSTQPQTSGFVLNSKVVVVALWFTGMLLLFARILLEILRVSRLRHQFRAIPDARYQAMVQECCSRAGVRKMIAIRSSPAIQAPLLMGWRNPTLVLPETLLQHLTDTDLRCIILHEVVHVRRRDIALNWILAPLQILHWFNPLVWISFKCWRADREAICDRETVRLLPAEDQPLYGETLLKILALCKPQKSIATNAMCLFDSRWELKRRITLLDTQQYSRAWTFAGAALLAVAGLTLMTRAGEPTPKPRTTEVTDAPILIIYDVSDFLNRPADFGPGAVPAPNTEKTIEDYVQRLSAKGAKIHLEWKTGKAVVTALPATQERIQQFISRLRHAGNLQVLTSFKILEAKSAEALQAVLNARGVQMDERGIAFVDAKKALEVSSDLALISAPRLATYNNQRAYVEISQKDPNAAADEFEEGLRISTRNIVSADQRYVSMEIDALIKSRAQRVTSKTTLTVPDGTIAIVLLNAEKKGEKYYALLCSATVVDHEFEMDDQK